MLEPLTEAVRVVPPSTHSASAYNQLAASGGASACPHANCVFACSRQVVWGLRCLQSEQAVESHC